MTVDILVEGHTDEAVARRLIAYCRHESGTAYGKRGHNYLHRKASGFNVRAQYGNPILVLVDFMDTGLRCPPEVTTTWLRGRSEKMLLRVVVRELESWLLADVKGVSRYFGISVALMPKSPEKLRDPKQTLINLARRSRRKALRDAIVPRPNISSVVGPGYASAIEHFVNQYWSIAAALKRSPTLQRCVTRLGELA